MICRNNIFVLGAFGYRNNQLDGQTIKTRHVYELLVERSGRNVTFFDTKDVRHNPFLLLCLFAKIVCCKTLVIIPCLNNLTYIFPVTYYLSKIFRFDIVSICVGGWQYEYFNGSKIFKSHPLQLRLSKSIKAFLPQIKKVNDDLIKAFGFQNTEVLPNFRKIEDLEVNTTKQETLDIVFMARVNKKKGYPALFALADYIRDNGLDVRITFYGQIDPLDAEDFNDCLQNHKDIVDYKGVLEPDEIHFTLNKYDVMVLPTTYYTEGFPGSILDAYIAGIPVIVTDWKHSHEFVEDNKTGYIIPFADGQAELNEKVEYLLEHRSVLNEMKVAARKEAFKYSEDAAWNVLKKYL